MSAVTLRLVLIIACAHALVHIFELSLPSVEQLIGAEFSGSRQLMGWMGTAWRVPFGVGALLAGWLVDRYGSKPLLMLYLLGCASCAVLVVCAGSLEMIFVAMFLMGCCASIYHPAGLAYISRITTPENRAAALGWHGVLGSAGIASAPLMASAVFAWSHVGWREYYLLLTLPALLLAVVIAVTIRERPELEQEATSAANADVVDWRRYLTLVSSGALFGFIYAAFMHFLPRYLDQVGWDFRGVSPESMRNLLAAFVLMFAIAGQAFAGRVARPQRLVKMLTLVMLANAPILLWVSLAAGSSRFWAMCALAFVHFMSQPVYNSLIASYIPSSRRSVGYGFSNMACFGFGALGPAFAGYMPNDTATYGALAGLALLAGGLTLMLRQTHDQPQ